jgi:hypothetical protein
LGGGQTPLISKQGLVAATVATAAVLATGTLVQHRNQARKAQKAQQVQEAQQAQEARQVQEAQQVQEARQAQEAHQNVFVEAIKEVYLKALRVGFYSMMPVLVRLNALHTQSPTMIDQIRQYCNTILLQYLQPRQTFIDNIHGNQRPQNKSSSQCSEVESGKLKNLQHLAQICNAQPTLAGRFDNFIRNELNFLNTTPDFKAALSTTNYNLETAIVLLKQILIPALPDIDCSNVVTENDPLHLQKTQIIETITKPQNITQQIVDDTYKLFNNYVTKCKK